jgi:hypothetical protein
MRLTCLMYMSAVTDRGQNRNTLTHVGSNPNTVIDDVNHSITVRKMDLKLMPPFCRIEQPATLRDCAIDLLCSSVRRSGADWSEDGNGEQVEDARIPAPE